MTADAYGAGEADTLLVGAVGHDFYEGERDGAKGYPRFTDPRLRGPEAYGDYLRMATERSLERIGADSFDVLLLHNPDRRGFESPEVWKGLRRLRDEGLTGAIGVAPGPANGFTLDVIGCFERYGELIDWAMLILGPLEPWPGELPLAAAQRHGVSVVTRVVDYGGLLHDDVLPGHEFPRGDHRGFRPDGWVEAGRAKLDRLRPIAARHDLTPLQLACAWNLAHPAVECVAPTLIEEPGGEKPVEHKRAELAAVPATSPLSPEEVDEIRAIGDNSGSMLLKGATPDHEGDEAPDRWSVGAGELAVAERWGIDPERDLRRSAAEVS
jgi:aryl-alcohol dehydrogenase-like predicted oxidoreductase